MIKSSNKGVIMKNKKDVVIQPSDKNKKLEAKANTLKAFLFSLLIMLGGAVLWGVIYSLGFFSSWISFLPAFGAIFVYKKFKQDGRVGMLFYILGLSILFNYFAMLISATISVMALVPGATFGQIFPIVFETSFGGGVADTIGCIGFTGLGVGLGYVSAVQQIKKKQMVDSYTQNQTTITPMPNGSVAPIQEPVAEVNASAEDNKSKEILTDLTGYIEMYQGKLIEKDEFLKLVENFKKETIDKLTEEEKADLAIECAEVEENENREIARKLLIKILAK